MGSVGQSHMETLLGPDHQDQARLAELGLCAGSCPTSPPPAPCSPRTGFETRNYIFTLQNFGQTQGIHLSGKGFSQYFLQWLGRGAALAALPPTGPSLVVFVLLSHLYLFNRPDKASTCDALFILWLSLEHIKLIITPYEPEIGIFFAGKC